MFRTIPRYEEDGLGLPYPIVLIDVAEEEIDDETGESLGVSVPDREQLAAAVAVVRAVDPLQLDGREVRFIRNVIGMLAKDFAAALHLDPSTFSRWENNKYEPGGWAEGQVRMAAIIALRDRVPGLSVDLKDVIGLRIRVRRENEWPIIEMRRVHRDPECPGGEGDGYDITKMAA